MPPIAKSPWTLFIVISSTSVVVEGKQDTKSRRKRSLSSSMLDARSIVFLQKYSLRACAVHATVNGWLSKIQAQTLGKHRTDFKDFETLHWSVFVFVNFLFSYVR